MECRAQDGDASEQLGAPSSRKSTPGGHALRLALLEGPVTTFTLPLEKPRLLPIALAQLLPDAAVAPLPRSLKRMQSLLCDIFDAGASPSLASGWSCQVYSKGGKARYYAPFPETGRSGQMYTPMFQSRPAVLRHLGISCPGEAAAVDATRETEGAIDAPPPSDA